MITATISSNSSRLAATCQGERCAVTLISYKRKSLTSLLQLIKKVSKKVSNCASFIIQHAPLLVHTEKGWKSSDEVFPYLNTLGLTRVTSSCSFLWCLPIVLVVFPLVGFSDSVLRYSLVVSRGTTKVLSYSFLLYISVVSSCCFLWYSPMVFSTVVVSCGTHQWFLIIFCITHPSFLLVVYCAIHQ